MALDATKTAMDVAIKAIEELNVKYPVSLIRREPIYNNGYIPYNPKYGQWYRDMKEQRDVWDY